VAGSRWQLAFAKYDWRPRDAQNERLPGRQGRHGVRSSRLACPIHDSVFVSIALAKDDTAIVFGEDVAFGGVFRCTMVNYASFSDTPYSFASLWQGLAEEFGGLCDQHLFLQ
jgi:hypothetical protein